VAKFKKKPVVIEAVQWLPGVQIEGVRGVDPCSPDDPAHGFYIEYAEIETLEGVMRVSPGDWVITGVKGEKYPCKDDIFKATYEALDLLDERAEGPCTCTKAQEIGDDSTLCPSCEARQELDWLADSRRATVRMFERERVPA